MSRVPLRARVALAFAAVSAVVLVALALFLHHQMRTELDYSLRSGVQQRLADLSALAADGRPAQLGRSGLVEHGDDVAQVLDAGGGVVAGAPGFDSAPLLDRSELARVGSAPAEFRAPAPADDGELILLASRAGERVVVAGAFLEDRDEALASLDTLLAIGVPVALLLAAGAGYLVAGAALRPIGRLRSRADAIGSGDLSRRLPEPPANDEVRRLAETLNGMLGRLEEAFARERTFVADASHELRTPLTRLKAELDLAAGEGRSVEELEAAVRSAADETDRLIMLAEDLLVLARADQGRLPLRPEHLDVGALLDDARRRFAPDATVEAPPDLAVVGDPVRLQQALANLLDNARRHGDGPVTLRARADGARVRIEVHDEGPGIPEQLRSTAFERFTRGDPTRDPEAGAGLGLAIIAAIATAHGGRAGIGEPPGSTVWMTLPR
jgi:heavy metal sensor kinase